MTILDPVSPRARDTLNMRIVDGGPINDALSRINSPWYFTNIIFIWVQLSRFLGEAGGVRESPKIQNGGRNLEI